ncbi:MAG: HK97 family phage prohead protease [Planctomycetota bacterium]
MSHPILKYINVHGRQFLDPTQRTAEPIKGVRGIATFASEIKSIDETKRSVRAVMSSRSIDRYGEIVEPSAAKAMLERFTTNPVMLKDHDHWEPIGHWEDVKIGKDTIEGTAVFAAGNFEADNRWALVKAGSVRAFSIGFIAHEWEMRDESIGGKKERVRVFTEIELIECSSVAVPANPDATVKSDVSGAIDAKALIEALKDLDVAKAIAEAIEPNLTNTIKQALSADPGGPMATLMQDFIELGLANGIHGDNPGSPNPAPEEKSSGGGHPAIDYLSKRI